MNKWYRTGEAHHRYGKTQSEETRAKMRAAWALRRQRDMEEDVSPIQGMTSVEISQRWLDYKNGVGPYPFKRKEPAE